MDLRKYFSTLKTPQSRPIPGSGQVPNSAGGHAWALDDWARLDRFLILGSEGGAYYIGESELSIENAEAVASALDADGQRVVERVLEISESGRAAKNDPALFVLAMAAGLGDEATRKAALDALPRVARIGTHLFHFLHYVEGFRGWGRSLRRGVGRWYTEMPAGRLAYQAIKYQQRDGWSHRDTLRLAHPDPPSEQHDAIFHWITQGWEDVGDEPHPDEVLRQIWAFERARRATDQTEIMKLVERYDLPWEAVPAEWLGSAQVWESLLPRLPMTATLRNLARLTANDVLAPMSANTDMVVDRITDEQALRKARIHPIAVLAALLTYKRGQGVRGKLTWEPISRILDALDSAFYLAFQNVEPSGKRIMLALDVSGSMVGGQIAGVPGLTPRVGAAAMSLITAATEQNTMVTIFSSAGKHFVPSGDTRNWFGESGISSFDISPRQRLDDVVKATSDLPFGGTDVALPMIYALKRGLEIDAFVVYTDSETWHGDIHPAQALQAYRRQTGIPAKLVVVGMVSNGFSVADPDDAGMLDVVGFDTATPALIADFIRDDNFST